MSISYKIITQKNSAHVSVSKNTLTISIKDNYPSLVSRLRTLYYTQNKHTQISNSKTQELPKRFLYHINMLLLKKNNST